MPYLKHPLWPASKLPPRTLQAINERYGEERRLYLAHLIESYEEKLTVLIPTAREMMQKWTEGQAQHLRRVALELHHMMALETSGKTCWGGRDFVDNTRNTPTDRGGKLPGRDSQSTTTADNRSEC